MYKLELGKNFKDLDGTELTQPQDLPMGKLLAKVLASNNTPGIDPLKAFQWALDLYNKGSILVDESDKNSLIKFITQYEGLTNSAKAQLLQSIHESKKQ